MVDSSKKRLGKQMIMPPSYPVFNKTYYHVLQSLPEKKQKNIDVPVKEQLRYFTSTRTGKATIAAIVLATVAIAHQAGLFRWIHSKIKYDLLGVYDELHPDERKKIVRWLKRIKLVLTPEKFLERARTILYPYGPIVVHEVLSEVIGKKIQTKKQPKNTIVNPTTPSIVQ